MLLNSKKNSSKNCNKYDKLYTQYVSILFLYLKEYLWKANLINTAVFINLKKKYI